MEFYRWSFSFTQNKQTPKIKIKTGSWGEPQLLDACDQQVAQFADGLGGSSHAGRCHLSDPQHPAAPKTPGSTSARPRSRAAFGEMSRSPSRAGVSQRSTLMLARTLMCKQRGDCLFAFVYLIISLFVHFVLGIFILSCHLPQKLTELTSAFCSVKPNSVQ